ncbi:unnamed protein product [Owenia fusiformis]|uniref:Uncharacterized protein n=1 Tax=Owenia fusiformis TaxID=6347 RepID=A0A8J1TQN2_OWEFU|nr:unnamed protein product [Owenia fusiformis]
MGESGDGDYVLSDESAKQLVEALDVGQEISIEMKVVGEFRLWMILGIILSGITIIVVILCCIFDCRVPRSKQEIEEDKRRRKMAQRYVEEFDRVTHSVFEQENAPTKKNTSREKQGVHNPAFNDGTTETLKGGRIGNGHNYPGAVPGPSDYTPGEQEWTVHNDDDATAVKRSTHTSTTHYRPMDGNARVQDNGGPRKYRQDVEKGETE